MMKPRHASPALRELAMGLLTVVFVPLCSAIQLGGCARDFAGESVVEASVQCDLPQWWNVAPIDTFSTATGWWEADLPIPSSTAIQLRNDARLVAQAVYPWGWQPTFDDLTTGKRFAFTDLRPQDQYTTTIGAVFPSGTVVGLSGGDTSDTGFPTYSTGAHLAVQTVDTYGNTFPPGVDVCVGPPDMTALEMAATPADLASTPADLASTPADLGTPGDAGFPPRPVDASMSGTVGQGGCEFGRGARTSTSAIALILLALIVRRRLIVVRDASR